MKTFLRSNVRWNDTLNEFELRCEECASKGQARYWPLTAEYWNPNGGMLRCRACQLEGKRAGARANRSDPERHKRYYRENQELLRAKQASWYEANRERRLATMAAYHVLNRERINARSRARYAAQQAARREYNRDWMRAHRARKDDAA